MPHAFVRQLVSAATISFAVVAATSAHADLAQTISAVKPSVVAITSIDKTRVPPLVFAGTGFAVDDGLTIVTNAHVLRVVTATQAENPIGVAIIKDGTSEIRRASVLRTDAEHDLVLLRITGSPLPVLTLGDASRVRDGHAVAFTGFPLGAQVGLRHVTHRAMVSSITPIVMPAPDAKQLDPKALAQLKKTSFDVFQLDGTAYPGNSGSPVFDPETGFAIGIVNMVYVKGVKETAISNPSGISYAIPVNHIRDLLARRP